MVLVNTLGQQVAVLADATYATGRYALRFDVSGLSTGVYFIRAEMGPFQQTQRLTVAR